jgi:hypothetical protein
VRVSGLTAADKRVSKKKKGCEVSGESDLGGRLHNEDFGVMAHSDFLLLV